MRHCIQALGLGTLLLAGWSGSAQAQNVTELYVTPDTVRLESGMRQGLTVQAFDDAGNVILAVRYRVRDTMVARVATNGTVTAGRSGRTQIVVQAGEKTKTVAVFVAGSAAPEPVSAGGRTQPVQEIAQLSADPAGLTLLPSERGRIALRAFYSDGTPAATARVQWRSLRTAVATVEDSSGSVTGVSTGQATIQALVPGGPTLSVPVSVALAGIGLDRSRVILSPDDADTLTALVPAQGGRRLRATDLQWKTSDESVVQVTADGVVRALTAGRAELIVHGFLQEIRIPVIVHQRIARFAAAPRLSDPVRLPVHASREFTLIPQTADSLPIEGVPITWTVEDTTVAVFDAASGRLTALRPGTTTLQFAARGFVPRGWTIEVLSGTVAFERTRLALRPGERSGLSPQFVDAGGEPVAPATGLSWITSNASVARVAPDGIIQAVSPGRAVISAQTAGGQPSQATVFVTGDLLVASTRGGRFGVYALLSNQPESFFPIVADTFANSIDASYSPDRTRILYASDRFGPGNYDIFVADADGRNSVRLTAEPGMDIQPVWTRDGQRVIFVSARSGVRQVYAMRADGGEVRQLTFLPGGAEEPTLSPDGRVIAFTGYPAGREGQSDIFVVPTGGGSPVQTTNTRDRREARPVYLSSGELAWVLMRRDKREPDLVLRQSAAGGSPAAIVTSDLTMVDVAFAPDGSRVAWVASRPLERNRNLLEFTFQWRSLTSGAETSVRLLPGERITSPAF
jgi:hypothetical protein